MNQSLKETLTHKINTKTKPLGALGVLEDIALQVGLLQQTISPTISKPTIVVFAADHGIAATGLVNPYPQAVTAQMVMNFMNKGAAINVFTKLHELALYVVDAGVNADFSNTHFGDWFIHAKQGYGTKNYLQENAMSIDEVNNAIEKGKEIVNTLAANGCNCIGFGEMGISNTAAASLIMSAITGLSIEDCTGYGTGVNEVQLATKIDTLRVVHLKHQLHLFNNHPVQLLSKVGGFEIAMITGAYLAAYEKNMLIVVDGFIATAALLVAQQVEKSITQHCLFAHTSGEKGHEKMLQFLQAKPLLNLGLRLGEGTGAAIAMPIIKTAVAFLNEMASFEEANVSNK